jgi:hypothetical protein
MMIRKEWKRTKRSFEVGDLVFVRLQSYKQSTLKRSVAKKLQPRFYGPYKIMRKMGDIAYELELPPNSKIHKVFMFLA